MRSQRRSSRGTPRSSSPKSRRPWNSWAPAKSSSSLTPKSSNASRTTPTKMKKYNTLKKNSNNGYKQSTTSWTTTPIKGESPPTLALTSNSTTGEPGCRKLPTGQNSSRARTFNKSKRNSRNRSPTKDKRVEVTKTSPSLWWTTIDSISSWRINSTRPRTMSSTSLHWRSSLNHFIKAPPSR